MTIFGNCILYWTQIVCLLNTIYNFWVLSVYTVYWEQSVCLLGTVCDSVYTVFWVQSLYKVYWVYSVCLSGTVCIYSLFGTICIYSLLGKFCLSVTCSYSLNIQSVWIQSLCTVCRYSLIVCQILFVYTVYWVQFVCLLGTVCINSLQGTM